MCLLLSSPRLQTGVSSLQGGVFVRGICQEASLPPLLPQWMHSALAGAGKHKESLWSVVWGIWSPVRFVMKVSRVCHISWRGDWTGTKKCTNVFTGCIIHAVALLTFCWFPRLILLTVFPLSQHDTCPVCRKSLDGVDNSLLPTSDPLEARSIWTEQQERQAIWETGQATLTSFTVFKRHASFLPQTSDFPPHWLLFRWNTLHASQS